MVDARLLRTPSRLSTRRPGPWRPLTRRSFVVGAAAAGLAACGDDRGGGRGRDATRTIDTAQGRIRVPTDPQRVVCLDPGFSWQTLVEVGLTPVGIPVVVPTIVQPGNLAAVDGVRSAVTDAGEPDLERIAALRPDLILASTGAGVEDLYPKLSEIAPTAVFRFDFPSDWVDLARAYAGAVNRAGRLDGVVEEYRAAVADLKAEHGPAIARQRWALVTQSQGQVFAWGTRSSAGPALRAAGARFSAGAPGDDAPFTQLSLEKLDALADATVILYGEGTDGKPYLDTGRLLEQRLFQSLPAARAGRLFPLPSWFAYCYDDALQQVRGLADVSRRLT